MHGTSAKILRIDWHVLHVPRVLMSAPNYSVFALYFCLVVKVALLFLDTNQGLRGIGKFGLKQEKPNKRSSLPLCSQRPLNFFLFIYGVDDSHLIGVSYFILSVFCEGFFLGIF